MLINHCCEYFEKADLEKDDYCAYCGAKLKVDNEICIDPGYYDDDEGKESDEPIEEKIKSQGIDWVEFICMFWFFYTIIGGIIVIFSFFIESLKFLSIILLIGDAILLILCRVCVMNEENRKEKVNQYF